MNLEIMHDWNYNRLVIYLWDDLPGHGMRFYSFNGRDLIETDVNDMVGRKDDGANPLLVLPMRMGDNVLKLLADHLQQSGIKTEKEDHLKGKLEATEKHLEDMRFMTKTFAVRLNPVDPELEKAWIAFLKERNP
jgi:hypothetical protein